MSYSNETESQAFARATRKKRHSLGIEVSKKVGYEPRGAGSQFATMR